MSEPTWKKISLPLQGAAATLVAQIFLEGPIPRSELARRLGMSTGSLTRITRPLIDGGLLREEEAVVLEAAGRPSIPLDLNPHSHSFLGVKLTSENLVAVLTDIRGEVLVACREELYSTDPSEVADVIANATVRICAESSDEPTAMCVTFGGRTSDHKTIDFAPFLDWRQVPLASMVEERTGVPCIVENDVVALAQTEHVSDFAANSPTLALLTIGEGIGYALISSGRVIDDPRAGFEMVAHQQVSINGPSCNRGHSGCAAAYLTTSGLRNQLEELGYRGGVAHALRLGLDGDPVVNGVFQNSARALGILLASITNAALPSSIIVCGEGVEAAEAYSEVALATMSRNWVEGCPPPNVDFRSFDHTHWAKGAAVAAMLDFVLGDEPLR